MLRCKLNILLTFCFLLFTVIGYGQTMSHSGVLPWVKGRMPELNQKEGRWVKVLVSSNNFERLRKEDAVKALIQKLAIERGVVVNVETIMQSFNNRDDNGRKASQEFSEKVKIKSGDFQAVFSKIDEYYEYKNGSYHLWVLYLVAEDGKPLGKIPSLAYKVDKGAWRSFLFPGWAQLYQGRTGKGLAFIAGEAALVGAGVYFNNQYKNNNKHFLEATSAKIKQEYRDRADKKRTYSYVAFGAAGALYIYNIIDALTSKKGKVSYDYDESRFALYPTTQYNYATNSTDVMATVRFKF